jgi:hypothetical protein
MATRYWNSIAPKRGKERERLARRCGGECFLMLKERKFPICRKCGLFKCPCKRECSGLKAAVIRGRQWGHDRAAKRARTMFDAMGCNWNVLRRKRGTRNKRKKLVSKM